MPPDERGYLTEQWELYEELLTEAQDRGLSVDAYKRREDIDTATVQLWNLLHPDDQIQDPGNSQEGLPAFMRGGVDEVLREQRFFALRMFIRVLWQRVFGAIKN